MIYVGYPCIGKSSIAGQDRFIDLESSLFNDGSEHWEDKYVAVAKDLDEQGYDVFVSSHIEVRLALKEKGYTFICIFPDSKLYDYWFTRTAERYKDRPSDKNLAALVRVTKYFYSDIESLDGEENCIVIKNNEYDLEKLKSDLISLRENKDLKDSTYEYYVRKRAVDIWEKLIENET